MNNQCQYESSFIQATRVLNIQGEILRFYYGMSFVLIQTNEETWGPGRSTVIASIVVAMWRILLIYKLTLLMGLGV